MPQWLKDAVFYEIYPQTFCDTNGDGIGDIAGIISKLDYVKSLGCNAIWLNPIFDSPFMDAGYDVRNYKLVAERYGTNDDLIELFNKAHERELRFFLTSFQDILPTNANGSSKVRSLKKMSSQTVIHGQIVYGKHRHNINLSVVSQIVMATIL